MTQPRLMSGLQAVRVFQAKGWRVVRQRGSHMILVKEWIQIITVENLSKRYHLGQSRLRVATACQVGATTLRESVERWVHRMRGEEVSHEAAKPRRGEERDTPSASAQLPWFHIVTLLTRSSFGA